MPVVIVPPPYRGPTRGEGEVKVGDGTVRSCLEAVERQHPGFLSQVVDGGGEPHGFVRLFLNAEPLRDRQWKLCSRATIGWRSSPPSRAARRTPRLEGQEERSPWQAARAATGRSTST